MIYKNHVKKVDAIANRNFVKTSQNIWDKATTASQLNYCPRKQEKDTFRNIRWSKTKNVCDTNEKILTSQLKCLMLRHRIIKKVCTKHFIIENIYVENPFEVAWKCGCFQVVIMLGCVKFNITACFVDYRNVKCTRRFGKIYKI